MSKTNKSVKDQHEENLMKWVGYWRANPQRFAKEYLNLHLFLYQKILLYMMNKVSWFMYIAARGQGKSYLIAIYCVIRCILYPGTRVVIASSTRKQAALIITEKIIGDIYNKSYAVRCEVQEYSASVNNTEIIFRNGSKISAETSSDNSRGLRGNILIVDEFRLVKKEIIDDVLKPMLNVYRIPPYMNKPEYMHLPREENKQLYISSAWYQSDWAWTEFQSYMKDMMTSTTTFVCSLPYQLSLYHKILPKQTVEKEKLSDTFDQTSFNMEYEALFVGENDKGYFKLADINKCRNVTKAFVPPTSLEYAENQSRANPKNISNLPRVNKTGEIRLISLDIALMGGSKQQKNDSSAFMLFRLIQDGNKYRREVVYIETIHRTIADDDLAVRLKQLYEDFEADYVVMDTNGVGLGVYNSCTRILHDEERDKDYEPWSCINDEEMNKARKDTGVPVVYSVKADAKFNHIIATSLKTAFENGRISIPCTDIEKREELVAKKGFLAMTANEQQRQLYAFQQASAMTSELVGLEYTVISGNIKIQEVGTATKDRYSALAYGNHYANEFEKELNKDESDNGFGDFILF